MESNEENSLTPVDDRIPVVDETYTRSLPEEEAGLLASACVDEPDFLLQLDEQDDYATPPSSPLLDDTGLVDIYISQEPTAVAQTVDGAQQQHGSTLYTNRKYRIHLGTRPGSCSPDRLTYEEVRWRHQKLITLLDQIRAKVAEAGMKQYLFHIVLSDAISTTENWGIEPYAAITFESCSRVWVEGVAAIIGRIFRQDGIGIFDDGDDYSRHDIGQTADTDYYVRRFFIISRSDESHDLSISNEDARTIMTNIRKKYSFLSGQFGKTKETIELHDFEDKFKAETIRDLQQIVKDTFTGQNHSYQIEEKRAKSRLLGDRNYGDAIKLAELEFLELFLKLIQVHGTVYPLPPVRKRNSSC